MNEHLTVTTYRGPFMRDHLVTQFSEAQINDVDSIIESYRNKSGSLLIVLEEAQKICTYLPLELQRYIAGSMNVSASIVQGVVTFYSYFSTVPKGRKVIKVCSGTACYVKRSQEIKSRLLQHLGIAANEVTADGEYSLEEVRCLGACGLAPIVMVGDETFGLVEPEKAEEILNKE